jgi:hypothetical protein
MPATRLPSLLVALALAASLALTAGALADEHEASFADALFLVGAAAVSADPEPPFDDNRGGAGGDWTAWAAEMAEERYGGTGFASIGALGANTTGQGPAQGWDGGWDRSGTPDQREAKARARIDGFFDLVDEALEPVEGSTVAVDMQFIREAASQPILLAVLAVPAGPITIARSIEPPWLVGTVVGTFAGAARIGDVFVPAGPGEVFGEVNTHLQANVEGARASFFFGAANDFLGSMTGSLDSYQDSFENGALWLPGCPDRPLREALGRPSGCTDRWTLQISPTVGMHVRCVQEAAAVRLGFTLEQADELCPALTALNDLPGGAG